MQKGEDRAYLSKSVLDDIEADGVPGLVRAVGRMISDDQPSFECFSKAGDDFQSAADAEQFWDAALDFAACLREAELDPEPPEPPDPPPEDPHPDPPIPPGRPPRNVADIVLAALVVQLKKRTPKGA